MPPSIWEISSRARQGSWPYYPEWYFSIPSFLTPHLIPHVGNSSVVDYILYNPFLDPHFQYFCVAPCFHLADNTHLTLSLLSHLPPNLPPFNPSSPLTIIHFDLALAPLFNNILKQKLHDIQSFPFVDVQALFLVDSLCSTILRAFPNTTRSPPGS